MPPARRLGGALLAARGWRGAFFRLCAGALASLGQAPLGAWPLALAGFAFLFATLARSGSARAAFRDGLFFGAGWFGLGLNWILQPFFVDPWAHAWMAPFALFFMALGFGLFWGVACALARRFAAGPPAAVMAALWVSLAELLRGHIFTGFPWALPGHIWTETWLAQSVSLIGAYGLSAVTLLGLAAPFSWGLRRGGLAALGLALAGLSWAGLRLNLPEPAPLGAVVRIVQPNIEQSLKWEAGEAEANFRRLMRLSAGGPADLILWPETSVPYLMGSGEGAAVAINAASDGRPVLAGYQRVEGFRAWNSLGLIEEGGQITQNFDKIHLVPFGEYMPAGDWLYRSFGVSAFAAQSGAGYTAGRTRDLFDLGALGRALPLICYEGIFPRDLVVAERADWMVLATNDAWFGRLTGPYQHLAQARLRAIEQGLPLVRAANTGISAVYDARGRLALDTRGAPARLPLGVEGVIDAALPGALAPPPYARSLAAWGEAPIAVIVTVLIGFGAFISRRRHGLT